MANKIDKEPIKAQWRTIWHAEDERREKKATAQIFTFLITLEAHSHFIIAQHFISDAEINAKEYITRQ